MPSVLPYQSNPESLEEQTKNSFLKRLVQDNNDTKMADDTKSNVNNGEYKEYKIGQP